MQSPNLNNTLLRFATLGLGYDKVNVDEHGIILNLLEKLATPYIDPSVPIPKKQTIAKIMLPRASYKTTIGSVSFPMWVLDRNPDLRILVDSETYNLSKSILSEIKQQYESGPYTRFHPPIDTKNTRWSEDSIILPSRKVPKKEGSINAAGLDGIKAGMHYEIIIADDLHSQHNTKTQHQIDQVIEHYRLLLSILEPHGTLIVIGTRWAAEDAYSTIENDSNYSLFIPAASTVPMNHASDRPSLPTAPLFVYDHTTKDCIQTSDYFLNFPKTLNEDHLKAIHRRQGDYIFSAQYLLRPVASRDRRFRDEWIQFYEESTESPPIDYIPTAPPPLSSKFFRRIGFVDPAFTTQDYSDPSGIVIVATNSKRDIYVKYAEQHKLEPYQLIELLFQLTEQHGVGEWYIEDVAAQKVLKYFLEYLAGREKKRLVFNPIKSGGRKKEHRVYSLQPYFQNKKIYLHKSQEILLQQIKNFPILRYDDVLDALAYVPQVVYDGMKVTPLSIRPEGYTLADALKSIHKTEARGIRPMNTL